MVDVPLIGKDSLFPSVRELGHPNPFLQKFGWNKPLYEESPV